MGNCWAAEVKSSLGPSTTETSSPVSRNSHNKSKSNKRMQAGNLNGSSRSLEEVFPNGQSNSNKGLSGSLNKVFPKGQSDSGNLEEVFPEGQILPISNLRVFSFAELKAATGNFHLDAVLWNGEFGILYKGEIEKGLVIAVKKLRFGWRPRTRACREIGRIRIDWRSEVNFLGRISHPNLVKLLGYCCEEKNLFLVYEFMPKGSLQDYLFKTEMEPLSWSNRLKIAIGAARSLAFLHSLEKPIIYGDFKASNILFDSEQLEALLSYAHWRSQLFMNYNAKVSDIGLGKIVSFDGNSHLKTSIIGSYGHATRDYSKEGHYRYEKSDVYCFGVVLLEILSGRKTHGYLEDAKSYLSDQENLFKIIDSRLAGNFPSEAAVQAAQLTLKCFEYYPKDRPSMKKVLETLEQIEAI